MCKNHIAIKTITIIAGPSIGWRFRAVTPIRHSLLMDIDEINLNVKSIQNILKVRYKFTVMCSVKISTHKILYDFHCLQFPMINRAFPSCPIPRLPHFRKSPFIGYTY